MANCSLRKLPSARLSALLALLLVLLGIGARAEAAVPANDSFASRQVLPSTLPQTVSASNVGATEEVGEPNPAYQTQNSVWYDWTAPITGRVIVSLAGSSYDTALGVYAGSTVSTLTPLATNDDNGVGASPSLSSLVAGDVVAGTTYHIQVDGYNGSQGSFILHIEQAPTVTVTTNGVSSEGGTPATFTFTLSNAVSVPVAVSFNVGGTAIAGGDYPSLGTSATIPAGSTSVQLTALPTNDGTVEGTETIVLTPIAPSSSGTLGPFPLYTLASPASLTNVIIDAQTTTIYVNAAASGANNGASWTNAYTSLQSALAAAPSNSEIWVAQGTYLPDNANPGSVTATFTPPAGCKLYGGFAGTETSPAQRKWQTNRTILSGTLNGGTVSYHVVTSTVGAFLDGFTIQNGNATPDPSFPYGGGLLLSSGTPGITVANCAFLNNVSLDGGAILCYQPSSPTTFTNCVFSGNSAPSGGWGGAVYNYFNPAGSTYTNCVFAGNSAAGNGGALLNTACSPTYTNCVFSANSASSVGGAMYDYDAGGSSNPTAPVARNCIFSGGSAGTAGTQDVGNSGSGLLSCTSCSFTLAFPATATNVSGNQASISPSFVNSGVPAGGDGIFFTPDDGLQLSAGSVCVDSGTSSGAPSNDLIGRTRPINGSVDRGAYERQTAIYVNAAATGNNDGTSWANAFTTVDAALKVAFSGDQIWVAKGTYTPSTVGLGDPRSATYTLKGGVSLYGGFVGTETSLFQRSFAANQTTLSGDIGVIGSSSDNCYIVVTANSGGFIDGFVIRDGNSTDRGTGMYCGSSPTVQNCVFLNNTSAYGAVWNTGSPVFANCIFKGNSSSWDAGAVFNEGSSSSGTKFIDCVFANNTTAGTSYGGGAVLNDSANPSFTNCTFVSNSAPSNNGGAIYDNFSSPTLKNCIFWLNTASSGSQVYNTGGTPVANNCDFQGGLPAGTTDGGGNINSDPLFVNQSSALGADGIGIDSDDGFRLQGGSPCVNTGTNSGAPSTDILGNARILGGTADMGAYEGRIPTVNFAIASSNALESVTSVAVTVTISAAPDVAASVNYGVIGGTASAQQGSYVSYGGADFSNASGTLNFPAASSASRSFTFFVTNDTFAEPDETVIIGLSNPVNCQIGPTSTFTYTINDDDSPGIVVSPTSGLITTEGGGTASFNVHLATQPFYPVTLNFHSSNPAEGLIGGSSSTSITIQPSSYNVDVPVTITGVNDFVVDGNVAYSIVSDPSTSSDPKYSGLKAPSDVSVTNLDNDVAGFVVTPLNSLVTTEAAGTATFTVVLTSQPASTVTIGGIASSNPNEGTVSTTALSFNAGNWNIPQAVTVTGVNDSVKDGNVAYLITFNNSSSSDGNYNNKPILPAGVAGVSVTNLDDDSAGVQLSKTAVSVAEGGATDSFTVNLTSQPSAGNTVSITFLSSDGYTVVDTDPSTAGVQTTPLVFGTGDWNSPKTVTVVAVDDQIAEGTHTGEITLSLSSGDANYNGLAGSQVVTATIADNDTPGVTIVESGGSTQVSEATPAVGDTYTVQLSTQPQLPVKLVADLNPAITPASANSSSPGSGVTIAGVTYFAASDGVNGQELWRSDGTAAGTSMVRDINPGALGSSPSGLANVGGILYFSATDGVNGQELWRSDGTSAGTYMVKDINAGFLGSSPSLITDMGTYFLFIATDATNGQELWRSDGTYTGTTLVKDVNPGSVSSSIASLTRVGSTTFFVANEPTDGTELWKTDGTAAGTAMVKDILAGSGSSSPSGLAVLGSTLFFAANDGTNGVELWKSDGSAAGTTMVANINPAGSSSPSGLVAFGGQVYFAANDGSTGTELWKSDGTTTTQVKDIAGGAGSSSPSFLTVFAGALYFQANDGTTGAELWKSDGTAAGTALVKDINSGAGSGSPSSLVVAGTKLFFIANDGSTGAELWKSDGTAAGTALVKDIASGSGSSNIAALTALGSSVVFGANDGSIGQELWKSDGTAGGTAVVKDINATITAASANGSLPAGFCQSTNGIVFRAGDATHGLELWVTDGTAGGTHLVSDISPGTANSTPANFAALPSGKVLFCADDGTHGIELWATDGTAAGTALVADINPGAGSGMALLNNPIVVVGSLAYFAADDGVHGKELWSSDGTTFGTAMVKDINASGASSPTNLTALNGKLLFSADDGTHGVEPWVSNGSSFGTTLLADISTGAANSSPSSFVVDGTLAFFAATDSTNGRELWKTDGTSGGTALVTNISAGAASGLAASPSMAAIPPYVYFPATDGSTGVELWRSDGATTTQVKDIVSGSGSSSPANLTVSNGALYFTAATSSGTELWRSDGTAGGTALLKDINPGSGSSSPSQLTDVNGTLFFTASDGTTGAELWKTDGTTAGTVMARDIAPGLVGSAPSALTAIGGQLLFSADDGVVGRELWTAGQPSVTITVSTDTQINADTDAVAAGLQSTMTFTGQTWNVPQTVTVYAIDDTLYETNPHPGVASHTVTSTGLLGDPSYNGIPAPSVTAQVADNDLPPTVQFGAASAGSIAENGGSSLSIPVTVSPVSGLATSVFFFVSGGTATPGTDYTLSASPLVIPAHTASGSILLTPIDDNVFEGPETVILTISSITNGTAGTQQSCTATITDDEAQPTVSFSAPPASVGEGAGSVTVTLSLNRPSSSAITVPITQSGGSASASDYTLSPATVTIPALATSATFSVNIVDDNLDEDDETLSLGFGTITGASAGSPSTWSTTIIDNDPTPSVNFSSNQTVGEGSGSATITVTLSSKSAFPVNVPWHIDSSSPTAATPGPTLGTPGADYVVAASSGTIVVPAQSLTATLNVPIIDDSLNEPSETITFVMDTPSCPGSVTPLVPTPGVQSTTVVTITDNDPQPSAFIDAASSTVSIAENSPTPAKVRVKLTAVSGRDITVPLNLTGTATPTGPTADYTAPASVTITKGNLFADVSIQPIADGVDEPDETVIVGLGSPDFAGLGSPTSFTVTILDTDPPPTVAFDFSTPPSPADGGSISEGTPPTPAATITLTAKLSAISGKSVSVPIASSGAATLNSDYTLSAPSFTFAPGATSSSVTLTIVPDALYEADESLTLTLQPDNVTATASGQQTYTATILNDDTAPAIDFAATGAASIAENGGSTTLTVQLSAVSGLPASVNVAAGGTATYGVDYTTTPALPATITIPAGQTTASITINAIDDSIHEGPEAIQLTASAPSGASLGSNPSRSVTITDDDVAGLVITESGGSTDIAEGGPPSDTYTVRLRSQPQDTITVTITSADAAVADVDTGNVPANTLTFTPANWSTPQTVTVNFIGTDTRPPTVALTNTPSNPGGDPDYVAALASAVTVHVGYNGIPGVVVTHDNVTVSEADTSITDYIHVKLSTAPASGVHFHLVFDSTLGVSILPAQADFDLTDNTTVQDVAIVAVDDSVYEGGGVHTTPISFQVTSTDPSYNGVSVAPVVVNIDDNDALPGIALPVAGAASLQTTEPAADAVVNIPVTLSHGSTVPISVTYAVSAQAGDSATAGQDFVAASGTLSWTDPFTLVQNIPVTIKADTLYEGDETFTVALSSPSPGAVVLTGSPATFTIHDDDSPPVVGFTATGATANEGDPAVTVTLSQSAVSGLDTVCTLAFGGTTSAGDYIASTGTVTIPAGQTSATFTLTAIDDGLYEGPTDETVVVTFGAVNGTVAVGPASTYTLSIHDVDPKPTVFFGSSGQNVPESGDPTSPGNAVIPIVLSAVSGLSTSVDLSVTGGTAAGGADYTFTSPSSVVVPAGQAGVSVLVPIADDSLSEDDETIVFQLSNPSATATLGSLTQHTVTIVDNDPAPSVTFAAATSSNAESGTMSVHVTLSAPAGRAVTVPFTIDTAASTATLGSDYTLSTASPLVFAPGVTDLTIDMPVVADTIHEPDETVVINLGSPINGITAGQIVTHTATITDDDPVPNVSIDGGTVHVAEGSVTGVTVTLTLDRQSYQSVSVPLVFTGSTATANVDYTISATTVTIPALATSATVTITPIQDQIAEPGGETVQLAFGAIVNANASTTLPVTETVVIDDDDTAGITIVESGGSTNVTEGGATDTYTVVLTSQPTAPTTITINPGAACTVVPTTLSFDSSNWNQAQTVTVAAVDDAVAQGPHTQVITHTAAGDPVYAALSLPSVTAHITDNDSVGLKIVHSGPITVTEGGATDSYTIALNSQPTATVTLTLTPNAQVTTSPTTLTFTTANWNTPKSVVVTAVDDSIAETSPHAGTITYTAVGGGYAGGSFPTTTVNVMDNDHAGVSVSPTSGLTTTEAGGVAIFTVVLASQPTASVAIPLSSSNPAEGTVSPSSLTFTSANWFVPRIVTVTGVDDFVADGDQFYTIITGDAVSADPFYSGLVVPDVGVTNIDNDHAGVTITVNGSTNISESGGSFTYDVVLTSQPTGPVTVSTILDGQLNTSPSSLTFTSANWNTPQTIAVTAVDDQVAEDSPHTGVVAHSVSGPGYNGLVVASVTASITDNDTAGVTVSPTSGLVVSESGTTATFTVVLTSQPTTNVSIALAPSDASEGSVSPTSMTFTPVNWNVAQTATVTGVDDAIADGDVAWSVVNTATSGDPRYNNIAVASVGVTTQDNDTAGISVAPTAGLITTEAGGTAVFTVALTSQPVADVHIDLSSSDTAEGTVSPASLTFTNLDWNLPRTVTVTGVNDLVADGNIGYSIILAPAASADANYNGMSAPSVSVTNLDNDAKGVDIQQSGGVTTVAEGGATDTYTVRLQSQPTGTVTITITPDASTTVSPSSLQFDATNWNTAQIVTVTAVDNAVADGTHSSTIAHVAAGGGYDGVPIADVVAIVTDNDSAGIVASPTAGLTTTESGGTASFGVHLTSQPTASVTIDFASDDTAVGTISPPSLTFDATNWSVAQAITVTGVDDPVPAVNAPVTYHVTGAVSASGDPNYAVAMTAPTVTLANLDNDNANIVLTPAAGSVTTEGGGTADLAIRLSSRPSGAVTVTLTSTVPSEGKVVVPVSGNVSFDAANWNTPQTVTVMGQDDFVADGDQPYQVSAAVSATLDPNFASATASASLLNLDNDSVGIVVTPTAGLVTTEAGGSATFTIRLTSAPTAPVSISLSSTNTGEGTVSPTSVTFSGANFSTPQVVTVTGVDDAIDDGDQTYQVITAPAVSADPKYNGLDASDVTVVNRDNDGPGIAIIETGGSTTVTEGGATDTFAIALTSQPAVDVVVTLTPDAQITVDTDTATAGLQTTLTFTNSNWNQPQSVLVAAVDDHLVEGPHFGFVSFGVASGDAAYSGMVVGSLPVAVTDNDVAGVAITPTSGLITTELGGTATFTVALTSQPTATVTFPLSSSNTAEGTVAPASLSFDSGNWNVPQTVTVTGVPDGVTDGNQAYTIITGAVTSADASYDGIDPSDVAVVNQDVDIPTVIITQSGGNTVVTEAGGTDTYDVVLTTLPASNVIVTITPDATVNVSQTTLTFTPGNYSVPQTVTVSAVDDAIAQGTHVGVITHTVSGDAAYAGIAVPDVTPTILDNDVAGVTVSPTSGLVTTEIGGTATFTVALSSQPTANVIISLASSDTSQGTVSAPSLTFTPATWNVAQTVTVTGRDGDNFDDGDVPYQVLSTAASGDAKYNGIPVAAVSLTNHAVNNPPTLATVSILPMNEDDPPQVVPLTGISDGQAGENQSLTVTVTSSDPTILAVTTSYVSPASSGSFTLTPQPNAYTPPLTPVTITVTVTDSGGASTSQAVSVTVGPVNDIPQVTVIPAGIVVNRGATVPITYRGPALAPLSNGDPVNGAIGATDVETAPQLLVYQVNLIPSQGVLKRNGVPMAPNDTFTQQELNDGLVTYTHNNGTGASDGFAFTVLDDNVPTPGASALTVLNITINLGQLPPQVVVHPLQGTPPANFTFTEGQAAQPIDPAAIVFDQDSPNFGGGSITFSLSGPAPATPGSDVIGIQNQGTGPGQIGVSGAQVTYAGVVIGNISPTANGVGTDLAIAFTSACTNTEAQALLRAITYFNGADAPTAAPRVTDTRTLSVVMDDGTGSLSTTNLTSVSSMPIVVVPVNDAPTLANAAVLTFEGVPVDGVAVPTDLDGDAVTVSIATIPVKGTVTITDATTGAFHYVPFPGKSGTDTFTLVVDDGLATSAAATVTVTITGGSDARPWVDSDPPLEVLAGTILSYTVDVDSSDLASAPNLAFSLEGAPPAGMTITPIPGTSTAIVLWNATVIPGTDYLQFGVLVKDSANNAAGYQQLLIKIVPFPGGGG